MKNTLYVTDLDGTLLGSNHAVSTKSAEIIARLQRKGLLFSYATARSVYTGSVVTKNIDFSCPVIAHNGTFITDNRTFEVIRGNFFTL